MLVLDKRGDTIVEVLLAIAVVSSVLAGAYFSLSQSVQGSRLSQERGEAMKLLQGQVETLREAAQQNPAQVFNGPNPFCFNGINLNTQSAPCQAGPDNRYGLSIQRSVSSGQYTFRGSASWDRFGGGESQRIELTYRMYQ